MCSLFREFGLFGWIVAGMLLSLLFSILMAFLRQTVVQRFFLRLLSVTAGAWLFAALFFHNTTSNDSDSIPSFSQVSMTPNAGQEYFQNASQPGTVPLKPLPSNQVNSGAVSSKPVKPSEAQTAEYQQHSSSGNNTSSVSFQTQVVENSETYAPNAMFIPRTRGQAHHSQEATQLSDYLERAKLATVLIEAKVHKNGVRTNHETIETGSGIIVDLGSGSGGRYAVITNYHVAGSPVSNEDVDIIFSGNLTVHPTNVLAAEEIDLALLLLDKKEVEPYIDTLWVPAKIGNSDDLIISEHIWAIGSPFGLSGTITGGIVSGLGRHNIPLGTENQIQGFIQTDASVNPGNSGGPIVNERGEVVGVVVAIASKKGENSGVSFAIPINNAVNVAEQLLQKGVYRRPYLGVQLDRSFKSDEKCRKNLVIKSSEGNEVYGTRVSNVVKGSPADNAGIRQGDIIRKYNDTWVKDEQHFEYLVSLSRINEIPRVEVERGGKLISLNPTLEDKDGVNFRNASTPK